MSILLRDVEVDGARVDVLIRGDRVAQISAGIDGAAAETVIDGGGGALLPGLHDHHLHLLALGASLTSVDCSPAVVGDLDGLGRALRDATPTDGWVRATGFHEAADQPLDRDVLDRLVGDRAVRVQHRGGALWVLSSAALAEVEQTLDDSADVERDAEGRPNGRLWRYDARLRAALPTSCPDLAAVGHHLARLGITGVTDATPDLDHDAMRLIADAVTTGALPQRVTVLGNATGQQPPAPLTAGPRKLLLRDHDLPTYETLVATVADEHASGRAVAVHCVTRESLLLTLTVLEDVGALPGDRIEHASVVPPDVAPWIARLGLAVVTQPDLLRSRGDDYLREVHPDDIDCLYPYAGLLAADVPVAPSSDAPFGSADPWTVIASAANRATTAGVIIGARERVAATTALAGYLSAPDTPGGVPRRVTVGARADLCLLTEPLTSALTRGSAAVVRAVFIDGRQLPR